MKLFKTLLLAMFMAASVPVHATVIDFSAEAIGPKANGYTVQGVQFYDTMGANLSVADYGHQSHGKALAVFSDDPSLLRMVFSGVFGALSLDFGNDDPGWTTPGNLAMLTLFHSGSQVGQATLAMNRNDLMDQTISLTGIAFDEAIFGYVDANLRAINLIEVVDNITFGNAVPEPGSLALLGIGLLGVVASRRRKQA